MSDEDSGVPLVVADTGPLLCAGGEASNASTGLRMFKKRFAGRLWVHVGVHEELAVQVGRTDPVGEAARQTVQAIQDDALFQIDRSQFGRKERNRLHDRINAMEIYLKGAANAKTVEHWGEVDAILLAKRQGAILLTNDRAAALVAVEQGVVVATYAGVLRAEIEDGRLTIDEAFEACQRLSVDEIDHGLRDLKPLSLLGLDVIDGL